MATGSSKGLYREHPAGIFLLPALLARLGYPAQQAAYAVNAVYQLLTLLLMAALARQFLTRRDSRLLVTLLLLLPIAFTYRVRANQEQPLLMCLLATVYGIERSRASLKWAALSTAGLAGLFLVKGVFVAVAVAAVCGWLLVGEWRWPSHTGRARPWLALVVGVAGLAALAVVYEAAYTARNRRAVLPLVPRPPVRRGQRRDHHIPRRGRAGHLRRGTWVGLPGSRHPGSWLAAVGLWRWVQGSDGTDRASRTPARPAR